MKLSRAILLSVVITLLLTLVLQFFFGVMAFGLFLFLPLSFFLSHKRFGRRQGTPREIERKGPGSGPIEPR